METGEKREAAPAPRQPSARASAQLVLVAIAAGVVTFGVLALLINIFERKQEGRNPFFRVVELTSMTEDPELWGKNFPLQYDAYLRTVDMVRTRFGGSEAEPRTPTDADPRGVVAFSRIEEDPRLKVMWAGYPFAVDFREERGHAYMLEDQTFTRRQEFNLPGTCLHCHASMVVPYTNAGNGDLARGFETLNPLPYAEARTHVTRAIACIDCHDSQTMALQITRPAFIEGMRVAKAAEGVPDYDVNTMATRQEMRSFVCAQCHVEYYFQGAEKRLVYPWHRGRKADEILAYYDSIDFADWTHAETGARVLKAQHPEFELWSQGIHARAGVRCADCHMPYVRVGALKISDHHVRSPLLNISAACQSCHKVPEDELRHRVETIQARTYAMRDTAISALVELINDIREARAAGATDEQLAAARQAQRRAQFLVDFIEAENSMGFHADQEAARVLLESINHTRRGQIALRDALAGREPPAPPPAPSDAPRAAR